MYCEIHVLFGLMSLFFFLFVDDAMTSRAPRPVCVLFFFPPPQSSTTGNSLRSGVTTRSSSSTSRWSRRARPSPQPSSASTRSVWAAPSATTRSCSGSTKWSRSTRTGKKKNPKNTTVECGNSFCFGSTPVGAELRNDHKLKMMNWSAKKFNQVWVCRKYAIWQCMRTFLKYVAKWESKSTSGMTADTENTYLCKLNINMSKCLEGRFLQN